MDIWSIDRLALFLLFVIPGFVSLKAYSLNFPGRIVKSSEQLMEAVTYSCINYALLSPLVYWGFRNKFWPDRPIFSIPFFLAILFGGPLLLVVGLAAFRRAKWVQRWLPHPTEYAWDFVFDQKTPWWVIASLDDGTRIGGLYGPKSFAASGVEKGGLYLEQAWVLNSDGGFDRERERTGGYLISADAIKTLEFFDCNA